MKNCTQVLKSILCLFVFFATLSNSGKAQQIEKRLLAATGDSVGFLEYKPADYDKHPETKYPVIIFLHGIGERGDGTTQLKNVACCGLPRIIKLGHKMTFTWNGKTETFLVISPQCPTKYGMWPAALVQSMVDYAKQNLRIDTNRIFMTGLSMGGGGTMRYISTAAQQPLNLAAVATIAAPCTFSNGTYVANAKLPVWAFHAADDPTASVTCTEAAITKILQANPQVKPIKTIWPTGGHIVWDRVYTDTSYQYYGVLNIYEWFLGQNKSLPVNKWPVAHAGGTLSTTTATGMVTLDGSASTDADGKIVRYVWKKISGPSAGVITNAFGPHSSTTVTGLTVAGTYKYELAVVDDRAGFTRDTVTVNVAAVGQLPTTPVDTTKSIPVVKDTVKTPPVITDTVISAPPVVKDTVKTPVDTVVAPPVIKDTVKTPVDTVTTPPVVKDTMISAPPVVKDTVKTPVDTLKAPTSPKVNQAPVANAGADQTVELSYRDSALVNATLSKDSDGWIKSFAWSKVSGPASGNITSNDAGRTFVTNLVAGVYTFRVKVTDNQDAESTDDVVITVLPKPNAAPVANAGADQIIKLSYRDSALINATLSKDNDGWIKSFSWTKLSGPASCTIANCAAGKTFATNLVAGVYIFRVKVTDNQGAVSSDDVVITVLPKPNVAPIANAGADASIALSYTNRALINATLSTDADGWISSFAWSKVSGPASGNIESPASGRTFATDLTEGVYVFRVTVTDNNGAKSYDDVTINVGKDMKSITIGSSASIEEGTAASVQANIAQKANISVYPNPAISSFVLRYESALTGKSDVSIYDMSGNLVKNVSFVKGEGAYQQSVPVSDLKKGLYQVVVRTGNQKQMNIRLIKE